jgi:hypothetical protein
MNNIINLVYETIFLPLVSDEKNGWILLES